MMPNPTPRWRARSGFSLAELLIALTLTAVIGAAVTTLFVSQNRFFESQQKAGTARELSRSALNVVLAELRMIEQQQGVDSAGSHGIRLRVPFAMGIICTADLTGITAAVAPVPDAVYTDRMSAYGGYMYRALWRDDATTDGRYTYVPSLGVGTVISAAKTVCQTARVEPDSISAAARVIRITPGAAGAETRWPIMLYSTVRYRFVPAAGATGRLALVRNAAGVTDTLVSPFAGTARFRFHHGTMNGVAQDSPPADLSTLNGIELVLDGVSERPNSDGTYATVPFRTSVFFQNRRD